MHHESLLFVFVSASLMGMPLYTTECSETSCTGHYYTSQLTTNSAKKQEKELRSYLTVEVASLCSPSLIVLGVSVDVKQH